MKLERLINGINCKLSPGIAGEEVSGIVSDSRADNVKGCLFVCVEGKKFDGHSAAAEMLEKGCCAVVVSRDLGLDRQVMVKDTREALALLSSNWFGNPEKQLKLVGVTGTNGKTTITTVTKRILDGCGHKTGLIGTCFNQIGEEIIHTERSTPEAYEFFQLLRQMADAGCEYVIMEVSSQGLEQKRVFGCRYEAAAFTNLTQDHLDVHGNMENYYQAKKLLFGMCDTAVINIDDSYGRRLLQETECRKVTFSDREKADYSASGIELSASGCKYELSCPGGKFNIEFSMPGEFNVSNSTAAAAICGVLGVPAEKTAEILKTAGRVCGRAEVISKDVDYTVIRDYAHTPDAVEKILKALKAAAKGRVICLFGCGGNRDAKKRPLMAKAAAENADFCIVTSDNPRDEEPEDIISQVLEGMKGQSTPYIKITDRRKAIEWALENARKDDIVAIVGKGHEDYQILKGGVKIHFDEKEIVEEILEKMKH